MIDFLDTCPLCNTQGKEWHEDPQVFFCPNCASLYSQYGLVLEAKREMPDFWS